MPRPDWPTAAAFLPPDAVAALAGEDVRPDLDALRAAQAGCRGCPLHEPATQVVPSRGSATARLVLVGEQPGDVEDQRGLPFVGPAGRVLVQALDEAGVERGDVLVTNVVKHFTFRAQGKRRIHVPPGTHEVAACTPWLSAELAAVRPEVVVLLGATAGRAVLGPSFRVTQARGTCLEWPRGRAPFPAGGGPALLPTIHPSAVLRADDVEAARAGLVADLALLRERLR